MVPWEQELDKDNQRSYSEFFSALNNALQTGRRPLIPREVSVEHRSFVEVMQRCWAGDPADRPPFSTVVPALAACLRETQ